MFDFVDRDPSCKVLFVDWLEVVQLRSTLVSFVVSLWSELVQNLVSTLSFIYGIIT